MHAACLSGARGFGFCAAYLSVLFEVWCARVQFQRGSGGLSRRDSIFAEVAPKEGYPGRARELEGELPQ